MDMIRALALRSMPLIHRMIPPAKRGIGGRYPKDTRWDRLRLFSARLPYRLTNKHMRPDGEVDRKGRFHLPCLLFGHLYNTDTQCFGAYGGSCNIHIHECTCCGLRYKHKEYGK